MGKIITNGIDYCGSVDNQVVMLTRAEYTALPSTKLTDSKMYCITDESYVIIINGNAIGGSAEHTTYDATSSALTSDNVQDALDELGNVAKLSYTVVSTW